MSDETDKAIDGQGEGGTARQSGATATGTDELLTSEWTPEQVEEWREKAGKAQENWERLLRVSADFDNYKKRATRERQESIRFANESLLEKLVPILDNLEMALAAANTPQGATVNALKTGVAMIHGQLRNVLSEAGLQEIDASGKPFDPNWHEAVSQLPSRDVPEGHVLQQVRKGFKLNERLIRPASVVVAKKAEG